MSRTVVIRAHITGPSTVTLEEPMPANATEVEVVVWVPDPERTVETQRLSDYLLSLPPGKRTKEDIDQQLRDERNW